MKRRKILLLFGLGLFLGLLVLFGSTAQPAQARSTYQDTSCDELLTRILVRSGWEYINQPFGGGCEYLGVGNSFYITAGLSIEPSDGSPNVVRTCSENTVPPCTETTFHGYSAVTAIDNGTGTVGWTMPRGETDYRFYIFVGEGYDVMQFAEEILYAAESELPASDQFLAEPEPPAGPVQSNSDCDGMTPEKLRAGGVAVLQCRLHCDPNIMSDDELWTCINQNSGQTGDDVPTIPEEQPGGDVPPIPEEQPEWDVPTIPGDPTGRAQPASLGPLATTPLVPLAGALIGTLLGWLISVAVTYGNVSKTLVAPPLRPAQSPPIGNMSEQGLYWSERPWDEAGPGYVSREEYERTKDLLARGYKWTNGGWQTPEEIRQSDQWQQNNRAATAREDAVWQAGMERERQALEQREAELKKAADELQTTSNMLGLKDGLETINQELLNQNIYVTNPLQGDPTLIADGLSKVGNLAWDLTTGWVAPSNGLTCGDYVGETLGKVKKIIGEQYGTDAKVQGIIFEEKSTQSPQGVLDWFDKLNPDNHNLIKVILPDGSEWAVDFHQHNTGKQPPILRPWDEAKKVWQDYLGDEFTERISVY